MTTTTDVGQSGHYESPPAERRKPGRPRDPSIERRALTAARDLAAERGLPVMGEGGMIYTAVSMTAVAEETGVGKPTLYLRWANIDLLVAAALEDVDLAGDLGEHAREVLDAIDGLSGLDHGAFVLALLARPEWRPLLAERLTAAGHGAALWRERGGDDARWSLAALPPHMPSGGYTRGGLEPPGPGYGDPEAPSGD